MAELEVDLYEVNKQLYKSVEPLDIKKLGKQLANIGAWFSSEMNCKYFMLMCKQISYYTVFHLNSMNYQKATFELKKTLEARGDILDIEYQHSENAFQCWVREKDGEVNMYYLFTADWMVVEVD